MPMNAKRTMQNGWFPKELPPPFSTASASAIIDANIGVQKILTNPKVTTKLCHFYLARPGTIRRRLSIVNPIAFYQLAKEIELHWSDLATICNASPLSVTKPVIDPQNKRAIVANIPNDLFTKKAHGRAGYRYLAQGDVLSCYPSIYAHSIPWAIHTKAAAKADRTAALFGNTIDTRIRRGQDDQTMGIPIGPDTSLLISEVVLAQVDEAVHRRVPEPGWRLFDDFEFAARTLADGERILAVLQEELARFELSLNPRKTKIIELPEELDEQWTHTLRAFRIRELKDAQATDLIHYFDLAIRFAREYPSHPVFQYAVGRLAIEELKLDKQNWTLLQSLVLQALQSENGSAPPVWDVLRKFSSLGMIVDKDLVKRCVDALIIRHAPAGHSSDVAWALWMAIGLEIGLSPESTAAACKMDDSVVALLALDARSRGLLDGPSINTTSWEAEMRGPSLRDSNWLLSYEANIKGWLTSLGGIDHVTPDAEFGALKTAGVSFYRTMKPSDALAWKPASDSSSGPSSFGYWQYSSIAEAVTTTSASGKG